MDDQARTRKFSESEIWQLQEAYYKQTSIGAWSSGTVPHYLTSNPKVGSTYAEIVLGLLRDLAMQGHTTETVNLIELGAGHGRLCYHFFKHFEKYYESSAIPLPAFRYILSDISSDNIQFWKEHERFQPYIEKGWIDFARFDANVDDAIVLTQSQETIFIGNLNQALIVVANYFFDSIPQELFRIKDGEVDYTLIKCLKTDEGQTDPATVIGSLQCEYSYQKASSTPFREEYLNDILAVYRQELSHSHLLFPHIGIRCLERLKKLSKKGIMALVGDKGQHHLSNLDFRATPKLMKHGSFSLNVNFHAIATYCENQSGLALYSRHQHSSLNIVGLMLLHHPTAYKETIQAYERFVQNFGPDDFYSLKKMILKNSGKLTYEEITAALRMSSYDAKLFHQLLPDLLRLSDSFDQNNRYNLLLLISRIWDNYFPIKERTDIAEIIGDLLIHLEFYQEAILYFEKSILLHGRKQLVIYKIALCYCLMDQLQQAVPLLNELENAKSEDQQIINFLTSLKPEHNTKNERITHNL